jgi:hypothetical protein
VDGDHPFTRHPGPEPIAPTPPIQPDTPSPEVPNIGKRVESDVHEDSVTITRRILNERSWEQTPLPPVRPEPPANEPPANETPATPKWYRRPWGIVAIIVTTGGLFIVTAILFGPDVAKDLLEFYERIIEALVGR